MEQNYECTICFEKYSTIKDLEDHWALHFNHYGAIMEEEEEGKEKIITTPQRVAVDSKQELKHCNQCTFKTKLSFALKMHVRRTHIEKSSLDETKDIDSNNSLQKNTGFPAVTVTTLILNNVLIS